MRIALVHPFAWPEVWRGAERYLHDLAWYLTGAGHDVEVVTGTSQVAGTSTSDGVVVHRYNHKHHPLLYRARVQPLDSFGASALRHLLRRRYDLVHALAPTSAIAGRLSGHPTIYTDIGARDRPAFRSMPWSWTFFRRAVRLATACTALSRSAVDQVSALTGRAPIVLPPGVRTDLFAVNPAPREGPPRVLFPSDASEVRKGLDLLLAALARLVPAHPEARLQLAGPGDHRWALDALGGAGADLASRVERFPPDDREGLLRLYRDATATALPSSHEAFGLVLVESLACGTPVVCSDVGGPREIAAEAVAAIARHGDVTSLAEALERAFALARDPATPARCAARARHWDWASSVGPAHEALYRAVQDDGRRGGERPVWENGGDHDSGVPRDGGRSPGSRPGARRPAAGGHPR